MRLALLSPMPPERSGIAEYAGHWRNAMNAVGVDILTPLQGQRPLRSLAVAERWVAERDWSKVDVVHAQLGRGCHSGYFALSALSSLRKRPLVAATVHDTERMAWHPRRPSWDDSANAPLPAVLGATMALLGRPWALSAERALARRLDGLVTLTAAGARSLAAGMKVPLAKVRVIPEGIRSLLPQPLPPFQPVRLLAFDFADGGKGTEDLIAAWVQLSTQMPLLSEQLRLTIASGGSHSGAAAHAEHRGKWTLRLQSHGLAEQVDWVSDMDESGMAELVQRHHLVVLPTASARSRWQHGPLQNARSVLAWAVACGRGVIVSSGSALTEDLAEGIGVVYADGPAEGLSQVLADAVGDPGRIKGWSQAAWRLAEQRQWPKTGAAFARYFEELGR